MIQIACDPRKRRLLEKLVLGRDPVLEKELGVELVDERNPDSDYIVNRNCHLFTFGEEYKWVLSHASAPRGFIATEDPSDAVVIVYFGSPTSNAPLGHEIRHSGRVRDEKVVSKFSYGSVYRHSPHEVPLCYGSVFQYYRQAPRVKKRR